MSYVDEEQHHFSSFRYQSSEISMTLFEKILIVTALGIIVFMTPRCMSLGSAEQKEKNAVLDRLHLVWPEFEKELPADRELALFLAEKCKLQDEPLERAATIACLRGAVRSPLISSPDGRNGLPGPAALEVMLR